MASTLWSVKVSTLVIRSSSSAALRWLSVGSAARAASGRRRKSAAAKIRIFFGLTP
jgi:hypothetical protein